MPHAGCPHKWITKSQFSFTSGHNHQGETGDDVNATVVKPTEPGAVQSTLFYSNLGMMSLPVIDIIHHNGDNI